MASVVVQFLLFCLLSRESFGDPGHLFSSGSSALAWSSDELVRLRQLHERTFDDQRRFEAAPNLAAYLGLTPVLGIHLPIPVNVLLIGFDGDGKGSVQITPGELQDWFSSLDHVLPHARVPLSELTCKEDGYCIDFEQVRKPKPLHSYVHYNVSIHAIEVTSELSNKFMSVLEALSRSSPGHGYQHQIDVTSLETIIDGMLAEMGILWSYNVILVNPDLTMEYTYRAGFSKSEIDLFVANPQKLAALKRASERYRAHVAKIPGSETITSKWHPPRKGEKFDVKQLLHESHRWAVRMESWLKQREVLIQNAQSDVADLTHLVSMKGIHADSQLTELIEFVGRNERHRSEMKLMGETRVLEPEESCALDIWTGHRRWILMDLAAVAQDWGPYVGGDGFKTVHTLPSIKQYFSTKETSEEQIRTKGLRERLFSERENQLNDLHAYRVEGYVPKDILRETERDLLERFYENHCANEMNPLPLCQRIAEAKTRIGNNEDVFLSQTGEDLFMEWFGMDDDLNGEGMQHDSRLKDLFLAHASAVVSKGIRHIFIPPTLAWRHLNGEDVDISTPFAKSIAFRIHLLTDIVRDAKLMRTAFDSERLKQELMGLKLARQQFSFTVQHTNIVDDAALSTSLAASLRSTTLEQFSTSDKLQSEERLYFDSAELSRMLSMRLFDSHSTHKKASTANENEHLDVPIFVLVLDRDRPVFIDRHYIAKALKDMVVVAHNSQYRGQHPLGITCRDGFVGQTLAAPLKATLAAVLQHLGGLLPPHLGYSPEHRAIAHDWTWSIGANPFSLTSPGWKISQAQKDALHRTYILDTVDLSVETVNHGIRLLQSVEPSQRSFEFVKGQSVMLIDLLQTFTQLVEQWRRIMNDAGNLDFDRAVLKLSFVEDIAARFLEVAKEVERGAKPLKCRNAATAFFGLSWFTDEVMGVALLGGAAIALYRLLSKKFRKTKRN